MQQGDIIAEAAAAVFNGPACGLGPGAFHTRPGVHGEAAEYEDTRTRAAAYKALAAAAAGSGAAAPCSTGTKLWKRIIDLNFEKGKSMGPLLSGLKQVPLSIAPRTRAGRLALCLAGVLFVVAAAYFEHLAHVDLSTAVSLHFMLVVLAALRGGFLLSTTMAVAAVTCLDFFFMPPMLTLTVADPRNWITLLAFEAAALLVSLLSSRMRQTAAAGEAQRERTAKLYELSRAILLIDGKRSTSEQLAALIREFMQVEEVAMWVAHEAEPSASLSSPGDSAFATYSAGRNLDEPELRTSRRVLSLGTVPIGAMVLRGWEPDPLLADAVASLGAIALERARAIEKENRAEVARHAEQLRTAVLDGLAHGFKTPLTAIQTASSGLLTIGHMSDVQAELVSIIDEQALLLSQLTTRLLQTAALESKDVRLRRSQRSIEAVLDEVVRAQDPLIRARIQIGFQAQGGQDLSPVQVDVQLLRLALLQLIDNAAKYSTVGSMIRVRLAQDRDETRVIVENEGSSIPQEERERIFERFYRGADAIHGPTGTGLGLSIVKKTAEAHGGRAWVESDANCTRFFFTVAGGRVGRGEG